MLDFLLFVGLGIFAGVCTGLTPGLHVNTVVAILVSLGLGVEPMSLAMFIFSLAITHTFLDFIPSILLGVPSEDTALAVLPGHKLVLEGRGPEAIGLTLVGSIGCLALSLLLLPVFMFGVPRMYAYLEPVMGWVLLGCSGALIIMERKRHWALLVFLLSGALGLVVLDGPFQEPLLPLLTGLFGLSLLLVSVKRGARVPTQEQMRIDTTGRETGRGLLAGTVAGAIVGFLPGFGPSQAAVVARTLLRQKEDREFLITLGGINTANAVFVLVAFLTLGKTRSGAIAGIAQMIEIDVPKMLLLLGGGLVAGGIAFGIGLKMACVFPQWMQRVDYRKLNLGVMALIISIVFWISGPTGLLVLGVATCIGMVAHLTKVRKMHLMGVLIIPTALWFLGLA